MQKYQDGDYALNKHSSGIVYRFADGIVEITLADYLADNPGKSEVDFRKLKELSDSDYLERDRNEYRQTWKNLPLDAISETEFNLSPSPETEVIDTPDEAKRQAERAALAAKAWDKLTITQRRRYWKHHVEGFSTWKIAEQEGVAQRSIMESLEAAEKKIKKSLAEG